MIFDQPQALLDEKHPAASPHTRAITEHLRFRAMARPFCVICVSAQNDCRSVCSHRTRRFNEQLYTRLGKFADSARSSLTAQARSRLGNSVREINQAVLCCQAVCT